MPTDPLRLAIDATPRWSRRRFLGATASGLAIAALAGCSLENGASRDPANNPDAEGASWGGDLVDPGIEPPTVTLTDMHGEAFPFQEELQGKLSILFFGYTNCPDVCPLFLTSISAALDELATGPGSEAQVLFVGVDTARDTPEQLQTVLGNLNATFLGLTGTDHEVAQANEQVFNPPIEIEAADADGEYLVGHSSKVFAFTPDGVAHRTYPSNTRQQVWIKDLPRLSEGTYR